jgi:hypothetical protein
MFSSQTSDLHWRIGFEIELMAPKGASRQNLAEAIAKSFGGTVRRYFHLQSEFSKVPESPVFDNLTLGFEVVDAEGQWIAKCVDDLTLQDDLDETKTPKLGWYRIVSDDARLLELVRCQANASAPISEVLNPITHLFGTTILIGAGLIDASNMFRVTDEMGRSIAIAAPLPGERERPCELIFPPIDSNHFYRLDSILSIARSLGFTAPIEGAIHLHFDATPLYSARVFANLVNLLWTHGNNLKRLVETNPQCRRLGTWSNSLIELVNQPEFSDLSWTEAQTRLAQVKLTKYCDFNLRNIVHKVPNKETFEARIFPVWLESQTIIEAAGLIEAILQQAIASDRINHKSPVDWNQMSLFLDELPISEWFRDICRQKKDY